MITLNLKTTNKQEEIIKQYLENNATDSLADKINNGVKVQKDGKDLISKKDLEGFFKYATEEAQKLVEKGARSAMVEENIVYGWAMHYFEEDSILGKLYNEDGTEYKPVKKVTKTTTTTKPTTTYVPPVKKPEPQISLFDFLTPKTETKQEEVAEPVVETEEEPTEDDIADAMAELDKEQSKQENEPIEDMGEPISPIYMRYLKVQIKYPDYIIAYRLGDFYEVFGDNAKIVANELDLTLTGRDMGVQERVPMIGFPYHVAEKYFKKITEIGSLVVVDGENVTLHDKTSENLTVNLETGEVISNTAENDIIKDLLKIFGNQMEIRV